MTITVDNWVMAAIAIGFLVPALICSASFGYGVWWVARRRVARSAFGRTVRHAITRARPPKFRKVL